MSDKERVFVDANVLLYLLSDDARKAEIAETILKDDALDRIVSTQTLGEFINVARRKAKLGWPDISFYVETFRMQCSVELVTYDDQNNAMAIAERFQLSWWDSQMIATAIRSGADVLVTEDLQDGQSIGVRVQNPFA